MDNNTKSIGQKMKELRSERQMTLSDIQRLTGITIGGLGDIERGKSTNPGIFSIAKIAQVLGVSIEYLLHDEKGIDAKAKYLLRDENAAFLCNENFQPYFEIAQRAFAAGVSPVVLGQLVEVLIAQEAGRN